VIYSQQCPRCGDTIEGDDRDEVADAVILHVREAHDHKSTGRSSSPISPGFTRTNFEDDG
jgi:hypothetical protein